MVIYVPKPDCSDPSRLNTQLDATAEILVQCGAQELAAPTVSS